jgi:pimeloyl-ACP methyl ester carboxylesterase
MNTLSLPFPKNSTVVLALMQAALRRTAIRAAGFIAPTWTVRHAAEWFITPPRHRQPEREAKALAAAQRLQIKSGGETIHAWLHGNPAHPVVVFSHGWGGRGGQFSAWIAPFVAAGYRVAVFDHIAHGASTGRHAPITTFADGLADVVLAIEMSGAKVAALVGHSFGCPAIALALNGRLRHLQGVQAILVSPPASLIRYSRFFARSVGLTERLRAAMQWRLEQRIGLPWDRVELPGSVGNLHLPALIIHDQEDREVRFASGLAVARAWPGARFKRTLGLGHRRILRDGGVIGAALDFMSDSVSFAPPPQADEWSEAFASLSGTSPLF